MAKIDEYREAIQKMLTEYAERDSDEQDVELQKVFDTLHDHYQLLYVGWENRKRIFGPVMHLDIKNDKVWIQWNGTETDIAAELMSMGVAREDIVLGFHTPYMRQFSDFAVG
ncbi:fdxN element excision controlling factor protein XisI [Calothrix sp. PCC 7716]|nr:fdxN element excision controlling factor protein XisI [Calothrix sp. PCC 7716]